MVVAARWPLVALSATSSTGFRMLYTLYGLLKNPEGEARVLSARANFAQSLVFFVNADCGGEGGF